MGATSTTFQVPVGPAYQLAYTIQPGGGQSGVAWGQQPQVTIQDIGGNTVTTSTASVSVAQTSGTGLSCTGGLSKTASSGVATFLGCKVSGTAGSYTLTASSTGLSSVNSNPYTITPGAAAKLVFTNQPNGGQSGVAWTQQPAVSVEDNWNNVVTSSTASISLTPISGLSCTGGLSQTAVSGIATFSGCQIAGTAGSYTLTASASGLSPATSSSFNITAGTASQLVFTHQPNGGQSGVAWTQQPAVAVKDAWGNTVLTSTASITIAPTTGLTCTGGLTKAAVNGVATFAGCKISGTAGSYTLTASSGGLSPATSNSFNITAGAASKLVFTTAPGGGTHGTVWAQQPVVAVEDAWNNIVTTSTASIKLSLSSGNGFSCTTNPLNATGGSASFTGCLVTKAGSYTLQATSSGLTTGTSPITIT